MGERLGERDVNCEMIREERLWIYIERAIAFYIIKNNNLLSYSLMMIIFKLIPNFILNFSDF